MNNTTEIVQIRVHGVDGSIQTFTQRGGSLIRQTLAWFQPTCMFGQKWIEIPGERSSTTLIVSQVTRIDLVTEPRTNWSLPPASVEAVELSEPAFWALAEGQPPQAAQEASPAPDNTAMVLLDIALAGGRHVFLAQETAVSQPLPRPAEACPLARATSLSFLMRTGGVAVLNVANLVCFTVYPDPAQVLAVGRPTVSQRCGTELGSPQGQPGIPGLGERKAA